MEPSERRTSKGFGRSPRFADAPAHGEDLKARADEIVVEHIKRKPVLGIDPRLVLVLEFHSQVDPEELRRAGLRVLDGSNRHAVVAFADNPELALFNERLDAYKGPVPVGQKAAPHQNLFDSLLSIRTPTAEDKMSKDCRAFVDSLDQPEELRLDVTCWHPDDDTLAAAWVTDLRAAVVKANGRVTSVYRNDRAGVIVARVYLPSEAIGEFGALDFVSNIDLLPRPTIGIEQIFSISADHIPALSPPTASTPVVGIIDSGVASAHPLVAGAVLQSEALSPHIPDGEDRVGHGTHVASIALHGPIDEALQRPRLVPMGKVVSVAVLDAGNAFPDETVWEEDLEAAIRYCSDQGARVINLSVGDARNPFNGRRQLSASAVVDSLARDLGLVIITCTGNNEPRDYLARDIADPAVYLEGLLATDAPRILAPGTAALALTVGGISRGSSAGVYKSREPAELTPHGRVGWPSTFTRLGPGVGGSIKPELVASAGTHAYEPGVPVVNDEELMVTGAGILPGRLLAKRLGTSFAAPLVTRVALAVLNRFPEFSANLVRALVLLGAAPTWDGKELKSLTATRRRDQLHRVLGYGQTSIEGALEVTDHRAILIAEGKIDMDSVHVFELPIPSSFRESGGGRYIDIALAFDPPTRMQRLDYLGNKLEFYLVKEMTIQEIAEAFSKIDDEKERDTVASPTDSAGDHDRDQQDSEIPSSISDLGARVVKLSASMTVLSRGVNQRAGKAFTQRISEQGPWHVVVRSVNRWSDSSLKQDYALAVSLRRDPDRLPILTELSAQLEAVAELEVVIEQEIET